MIALLLALCMGPVGTAGAQGADGDWVSVGIGSSFGGELGAAIEYREDGGAGILGVGMWQGEIGAAFTIRDRFAAAPRRAFWELGYGPIAIQTVDDGVDVSRKLFYGAFFNVGYAARLSDTAELTGSLGFGYNSSMEDSALQSSTITTLGIGLSVHLGRDR